jgi:hypothetical protein
MKTKQTKIQFTFSPENGIGEVLVAGQRFVLEVMGFCAIGSFVEAARGLNVDNLELYDAYSDARASVLPENYPIKTTVIADLSQGPVRKVRDNLVMKNYALIEDWLSHAAPQQELAHAG